uniref:Reverse transcriptase domain-containing protein n=1 Tax=Strongyloides venezuelensis TaxID=75913 RepID=A0A0K0FTC1_STRVS
MRYLDFELKNRIMLDLSITTLPIPKDNLTSRRKEIIKKFNLKQRDLPSSIRDLPINEDILSRSTIPDQLKFFNFNKKVQYGRKRNETTGNNDINLQNNQNENHTCAPIKKAKIMSQTSDNTLLNSSFNVDDNWDKIQETIVGKKTYIDKVKENIKCKNKRNNDKIQNSKTANKHNNKSHKKPFKDQNPLETSEIDKILESKLAIYNKVWKREKVSEKEVTDNWRKASKELKIAARLLRSYDNVKMDLDGMKYNNIIKIKRAKNKTSRFVDRVKKLISQKNSHNKKDKANANYKIRKIVQSCKMKRNDKKMENIDQILHLNSERIKNLNKRIDIVQKKNDDNKIKFNFSSKPSLKSLNLDKNHKTDIPNETIEEYLTDLFKEEDTKNNGLLEEWIKETQFEQQNIINIGDKELFENEFKFSRGWKAAGLNGIYLALYKQLPSAKIFLRNWCFGVLNGTIKISKFDVAGKAFAIYKSGDANLPQNYRFINVLNSHFKILSKIMNEIIINHLVKVISKEQQTNQKNKNGLYDGIILNRFLQQSHGNEGEQLNQAWIDFRKAFDTISHKKLKIILTKLGIDKKNFKYHFFLNEILVI